MAEENSTHSCGDFHYNSTRIAFFGEKRRILLDNEDGLGSLLSICNALILKHNYALENDFSKESEVLLFLSEKLEELCPETKQDRLLEAVSRTQELGKYQPKPVWNSIDSFRDNSCSSIFDLLSIPLFHGWIVADKDVEPKCCDEIDPLGSSDLEMAMLNNIGDFTNYGYSSLKETLEDHQICVIVHKNQFHTAIKHDDEIYLLLVQKRLTSVGKVWKQLKGLVVGDDFKEITEGTASCEDSTYSTSMNFSFLGENRTILLHNGNGIKSLVAICNALILRYNFILEDQFTAEWELFWFLKEKVEELCPETMKDSLPDAVSRVHDLGEFNPKPVWNEIDAFRDNNCSLIFDVLQLPLFHGWIIPHKYLEPKCYDDIVGKGGSDLEKIMVKKSDCVTDKGHASLIEKMNNHEICVLVHNNGIHTAIKHEDELYLLMPYKDLNSIGIMWEKVNGPMVGQDFMELGEVNMSGEGSAVDRVIEEARQEEEEDVSEGSLEVGTSVEENDSEDSMEIHADVDGNGGASPTAVLDGFSSSSSASD